MIDGVHGAMGKVGRYWPPNQSDRTNRRQPLDFREAVGKVLRPGFDGGGSSSGTFGGESRLILGEIVNRRWTRMLYLCSSVCIGGYIPGQGPEMFEDMNISPNQRWIEGG